MLVSNKDKVFYYVKSKELNLFDKIVFLLFSKSILKGMHTVVNLSHEFSDIDSKSLHKLHDNVNKFINI